MRQGQLPGLKAELFLTCHPLGENPTLPNMKRVRLRGSNSAGGLAFPFSTLGCTQPVGNKGSFQDRPELSCDRCWKKNSEEEGRHEEGAAAIVSAVLSVCHRVL